MKYKHNILFGQPVPPDTDTAVLEGPLENSHRCVRGTSCFKAPGPSEEGVVGGRSVGEAQESVIGLQNAGVDNRMLR